MTDEQLTTERGIAFRYAADMFRKMKGKLDGTESFDQYWWRGWNAAIGNVVVALESMAEGADLNPLNKVQNDR